MKNNLFISTLALFALCTVVNLHAAGNPERADAFGGEIPLGQVKAVVPANGDTVTTGTSRIMVALRLGSPKAVLADGSWLYPDYAAQVDASGRNLTGTLVVRFAKSKVTNLTLADEAMIVALRQGPRHTDKEKVLVAGQGR